MTCYSVTLVHARQIPAKSAHDVKGPSMGKLSVALMAVPLYQHSHSRESLKHYCDIMFQGVSLPVVAGILLFIHVH